MTRTDEKVRNSPKGKLVRHTRETAAEGVENVLKLLEGRWKLIILFHLFGGNVMRFSDLERAIPAVSQKMLIQQLRQMEGLPALVQQERDEGAGRHQEPPADRPAETERQRREHRRRPPLRAGGERHRHGRKGTASQRPSLPSKPKLRTSTSATWTGSPGYGWKVTAPEIW